MSVDKVDQLINLMGELVITRAMLAQRTARLEPGQRDLVQPPHRALAHQHEVAVPAVPAVPVGDGHRHQTGALAQRLQVEQSGPVAESPVRLLQRDHVGADLADDGLHPVRIEAAVAADAFVDVVGGEDGASCPA